MAKKESLHVRHRPTTWGDVVGHDGPVGALQTAVKRRECHAFLLHGPSGVGKTTLARIAAAELGAGDDGLNELDAATNTGVEEMRRVMDILRYKPFVAPIRAIIIDECHRLSGNAWDSLLKSVEEPPDHVFWFFCTTQPAKLPETVRTRCMRLELKPLPRADIEDVIDHVIEVERMRLAPGVRELVVDRAAGSPRQAIVYLDTVAEAKKDREAAKLISAVLADDASIQLCRFLVSRERRTWGKAVTLLHKLDGESAEGVRILVCNYVGKALADAKSERDARFLLDILDSFSVPFRAEEGKAPLFLSVGRIVFGGDHAR